MTTTAWLKQISISGLRRIKEDPELYDLLAVELAAVNTDEAPLITELSELTKNQLCLLNEITSEPTSVLERWTLWDMECLEDFKNYEAEAYERLKQDLYVAVVEEKRCDRLDLGWSWAYVACLFQYGKRMKPLEIIDGTGNKLGINIFSGEPLEPDSKLPTERYQEPESVLEMSNRLSDFNDYDIRQRFESALRKQPPVYGRFSWSEELYPTLLASCKAVQDFYKSSAIQSFGIINAIV